MFGLGTRFIYISTGITMIYLIYTAFIMNLPWFKRIGLFFVPINVMGSLILVFTIIGVVGQFIVIDSHSHSVSDTLMNFAFRLVMVYLGYSLFAWMTSKGRKSER